jgi:tetratricopeptide (TPR) repeat protein
VADNTPPENSGNATPLSALRALDQWKQYMIAFAAVLTVAAQLWSAIEDQWKLALVTLLIALVVLALYVISHRLPSDSKKAGLVKTATICLLIAIPLTSLVGLYSYSYLPRVIESGTTIAVARFVGPKLPEPYEDCRPSDMLVQTLTRVGARFGGLRVFELPYSIDPNNRWAKQWAQAHGSFESADVVVYGEYSLYSLKNDTNADEIAINPEVASVPTVPLGFKSAPLYSWNFPGSRAPIRDLCASDLAEAGHTPPRFLDDARRIALAVVGLQALGNQDFETAQEAVSEAKTPKDAKTPPCAGDATREIVGETPCPGVLAYYLGLLDFHLGNYRDALQEFSYASSVLSSAAPLLNMGELYQRLGDSGKAIRAFDDAVDLEPTSVAALAQRAAFERDEMQARQAALDLARAMQLQPKDLYDRLALSRAIYQRGGPGDAACGIRALSDAINSEGFDASTNVDTLVEYGTWLTQKKQYSEAARDVLGVVLRMYPSQIEGNYELGVALENLKGPTEITSSYFRRTLFAFDAKQAHTDDDYLARANAEAELAKEPGADPKLYRTALKFYDSATESNAYASLGKGELELWHQDHQSAERDLEAAANARPKDGALQSIYGDFLRSAGRSAESQTFKTLAAQDYAGRFPTDEEPVWSAKTCSYDE